MSESRKLLIGFAVVGVICCCLAGIALWGMSRIGNQVQNIADSDPTAIAQIQGKIAEFDIPPGYQPAAFSMLIYDTVVLNPTVPDGRPTIILMQYNTIGNVSREQMEQSLRQAAEQQSSQPGLSMQVVDSFETVIRGETATVTVSEGGTEGFTLRQWMTLFDSNNGLVILLAQGAVETWDDRMLEEFIASIK
jgi:hypothetical protein